MRIKSHLALLKQFQFRRSLFFLSVYLGPWVSLKHPDGTHFNSPEDAVLHPTTSPPPRAKRPVGNSSTGLKSEVTEVLEP